MQNPEDNWAQDPDERNQPEPEQDRPWAEDPYGPNPPFRPYDGPVWPQNWPQPGEPRRD